MFGDDMFGDDMFAPFVKSNSTYNSLIDQTSKSI